MQLNTSTFSQQSIYIFDSDSSFLLHEQTTLWNKLLFVSASLFSRFFVVTLCSCFLLYQNCGAHGWPHPGDSSHTGSGHTRRLTVSVPGQESLIAKKCHDNRSAILFYSSIPATARFLLKTEGRQWYELADRLFEYPIVWLYQYIMW